MRSKIILCLILLIGIVQADTSTRCEIVSEEDYQRVGDIDLKEIYTKTDYLYECTITTEKQGPCEKWEEQREEYNIPDRPDVYVKDENFSGSSGELFNTINAFNGIQYIWAGWKGICTDGRITDFGWVEDPLFWASLLMQAYGNDMTGSLGTDGVAVGGLGGATGKFIAEYGACVIAAGIDAGRALQSYYDDDEIPCDPVDEFCGDDETSSTSKDRVMSIDQQQWNDALASNPELANYTEVVSSENGILLVRFKEDYTGISSMSDKEAQAAAQKMKDMKLLFDGVSVAASAAWCMYGKTHNPSASSVTGEHNNGYINTGSQLLIGLTNAQPWVGAVVAVGLNIAQSFASINTCNKKKDAEDRGARHIKTFTHKPYGMCHMYRVEKVGGGILSDKYTNFHYCCYPDVISRILVEQIKSQLAKGWAHCTDITFQDIEKVNFKRCTESQINDPGTINGKDVVWGASVTEREKAFQFKHKCIDYTEFDKYVVDKLGAGQIDGHNFEEQLKGLQNNSFEVKVD